MTILETEKMTETIDLEDHQDLILLKINMAKENMWEGTVRQNTNIIKINKDMKMIFQEEIMTILKEDIKKKINLPMYRETIKWITNTKK